jgi:hypothetical protein
MPSVTTGVMAKVLDHRVKNFLLYETLRSLRRPVG